MGRVREQVGYRQPERTLGCRRAPRRIRDPRAERGRRNRDHLAPWDPIRDKAFYTDDGQAAAVETTLEAAAEGTQDPCLILHGADIVGRVALSNIVRGMFLSASIGYWTDLAHTGRGLATEAVGFAVRRPTSSACTGWRQGRLRTT
jgi:RimJ/RimL family protein N-acetyltransferase